MGGFFYRRNKRFFSKTERAVTIQYQLSRGCGHGVLILSGRPPWIFIFTSERNWMAAAVESSGVPAMRIELSAALQGQTQPHGYVWLDRLAKLMISVVPSLHFYDCGGLLTPDQCMETGIAAGFLMGTYLLAKAKPRGYLWLMVGNLSAALPMMRQGCFLRMIQHVISPILVKDAYRVLRRKVKNNT